MYPRTSVMNRILHLILVGLAELIKIAPKRKKEEIVVMNMCGRGDKDIFTVAQYLDIKL